MKKIKETKKTAMIRRTHTFNKVLYRRFQVFCEKEGLKMSPVLNTMISDFMGGEEQ